MASKVKIIKWNDEEVSVLIQVVQNYPELWDKGHELYKDTRCNRRVRIWEAVCSDLADDDKDAKECSRKWGNVR